MFLACDRRVSSGVRVSLHHDRWLVYSYTITLSTLQRLVALRAVSLSAIPAIIQTMNDSMLQGVDLQFKIL
jgi:hypothetical protein